MQTGILTFEQFRGQENLGSSRIRGHWVNKYWDGAELYQQGKKYDAILYQKAYFPEHAELFDGVKVFDICDPDFLHWGYRTKEMVESCDAVTTSTEPLAAVMRSFTDKPVHVVPDRIDLDEVQYKKRHSDQKAKWVVWYGYSTNFELLQPVIPMLHRMGLGLIVVSNEPFTPPAGYRNLIDVRNYPHNWETLYDDICDGDIVVNPQRNDAKWRFKSNNKTLTAQALGMPVAETDSQLREFVDPDTRKQEAELRRKEIEEHYDVRDSAKQYRTIFEELAQTK